MAAMVIAGYSQVGFSQNLSEGLVAYYPFNGNANDESGNGNDGELKGDILSVDRFGKSNSAVQFKGKGDYVAVKRDSSIITNSGFSISFWVIGDFNASKQCPVMHQSNGISNNPKWALI